MLTMEDIVREGHPALRKVSKEVTLPPSEEEKEILQKMMEFLKNSQDDELAEKYKLRAGIGLAAPQIAINKRMIAIYLIEEDGKVHEYAWFNPKIISHSVEETYLESGEGCLSVDREVEGYVPRYARIRVKAYDLSGKEVSVKLKGLAAIAVQHEIDHLDGIMFYDRINKEDPFKIPDGVPKK
ncbi:peptide deformylase [Pullulanibacillus sp. KACC 23026]|uniref:peptide deformylase n=1 Tax=Pullulanibacillus sp. KACC 23026 TaxID=3028315 RepID=UPI0023B1D9ED|nr:peptide deformylase [Pullulanibacillus sp. KACC 23026]WEG11753.1 peptide deformylase [Pullulanibacillus sp. KACC 23026]